MSYFTQAELDEADELMAAQYAYQQGLDEQQDSLSTQEKKEEILWRAANTVLDAIAFCGSSQVAEEFFSNPKIRDMIESQIKQQKQQFDLDDPF